MSEALAHPPQRLVGRLLMTVATLMYSLVPVVVDFTETHVFHPDWTPHARFHMVWLLGLLCGVAPIFGIDANVLSFTLCAVLLLSGSRLARHRESG